MDDHSLSLGNGHLVTGRTSRLPVECDDVDEDLRQAMQLSLDAMKAEEELRRREEEELEKLLKLSLVER